MQAEFIICMLLLVGSGGVQLTFFGNGFLRTFPSGGRTLEGVARTSRRALEAEISAADKYFAFSRGALEFAIFPHARCPQFAASPGIYNRMLAWDWAAS